MIFRNRSLLTLLLSFLMAAPAMGQSPQRAQFSRLEVHADVRQKEMMGIGVGVGLQFDKYGYEIIRPDTISPRYLLLVRLIQENEQYLRAVPDAGDFMNPEGVFQDSIRLTLAKPSNTISFTEFFLPYFGMDLKAGSHRILLEVQVLDADTREKVGFRRQMIEFNKPETKLFRLEVNSLQVLETDVNGETWDYAILSVKDAHPDVFWELRRGGTKAFTGSRQKNTLVYKPDAAVDLSTWLTVSKGDLLRLSIFDFDRLTFNDLIGSVKLDPFSNPFESGRPQDLVFDRVQRIRIAPEIREVPQIDILSIRKRERVQVDGVTGIQLDVEYALPQSQPGIRYFLDLRQRLLGNLEALEMTRVVSGPAVEDRPAIFELLSKRGQLKLFVPAYDLAEKPDANDLSWMRIKAWGLLEDAAYQLWEREVEVREAYGTVPDLIWGQWKAEEAMQNDAHGLLLTCNYQVPALYVKNLEDLELAFSVDLKIDNKPLKVAQISNADLEEVPDLATGNSKGRVFLFVPYFKTAAGKPTLDLELDYLCQAISDEKTFEMGRFKVEQSLSVPGIVELEVRVPELVVRKSATGGVKPNLRWLVGVGDQVIYQSRMVWENYMPKWRQPEFARVLLSEKDELWVRVIQDRGEDGAFEMGTWSTNLETIANSKKTQRVKVGDLKKLMIEIRD